MKFSLYEHKFEESQGAQHCLLYLTTNSDTFAFLIPKELYLVRQKLSSNSLMYYFNKCSHLYN